MTAGSSREAELQQARLLVTRRRLAMPSGWRSLSHGLVLLIVPAATAAAALEVGSWWAWALHWAVATPVLCCLPAVYHEGTHGNLARHRLANELAATLAASLHAVPFETWRLFHLTHHAHAGTDLDSEAYPERWTKWTLLAFPLRQWEFVALLWKWTASTVRRRGPRWIRSRAQVVAVRRSAAATLLVLGALAVISVLQPLLIPVLLVPLALSEMLSSLTLVPEHFPAYGLPPGLPDQLDRTATFRSNPVLRYVMWNSNFHAAHHFAPGVPAHHLAAVDAAIAGVQEEEWRHRGYISWYLRQLRQLPWQTSS